MEPLIYPMLLHETCFLLASDFDKENWRDDAHTFLETLPSNEHSGSARAVTLGDEAGHVRLFFEDAIAVLIV